MVYKARGILHYSVVFFIRTRKKNMFKNGLNKRKLSFQLKRVSLLVVGFVLFCFDLI